MSGPRKKYPPNRRGRVSHSPNARGARQAPADKNLGGERLQKVLAGAGVASRRECEQFILEGRVEVDGQVVQQLGVRVDAQRQQIRVDGQPLSKPRLVYFAVNKPTGVVCTARDPAGRPRVTDLLPHHVGRVFCVGRLDLASEGLILVTNDGELAAQLTHPRHGVEKIYAVKVAGVPDAEVLGQLRRGVHLAEGYAHAVDVRVKTTKKNSAILEMVLDEGRNREIRRLLARVGHKVQHLTRIAVGPVRLGELPRGAARPLTSEEVAKLRQAVDRLGPRRAARLRAELAAQDALPQDESPSGGVRPKSAPSKSNARRPVRGPASTNRKKASPPPRRVAEERTGTIVGASSESFQPKKTTSGAAAGDQRRTAKTAKGGVKPSGRGRTSGKTRGGAAVGGKAKGQGRFRGASSRVPTAGKPPKPGGRRRKPE